MYQPPKPTEPQHLTLQQWRAIMNRLYECTNNISALREQMRRGEAGLKITLPLSMNLKVKRRIYEEELGLDCKD